MDGRKIALLVGGLLLAAVAAFMVRTMLMGQSAPKAAAAPVAAPPPVDGPLVLVATRALPIGTILDPTAIKFQPWPKELVDKAYYLKDRPESNIKQLQGTVVRVAITAGQPITQGALVKPGDRGFLAAALGPGMRAVTVPVSAQTAVAGFVFPGDRIDLMLTQSVAGGGDGPPLKVTETVLRNLRVLATDQRTDNTTDENGKTVVHTFSTVTVEATPKIAEKIAVVQTLGSLTVALRSIADNAQELEEKIASGAVSVPDGGDVRAERAMMLKAEGEPASSRNSYATGADVSRYQRSTVPGKPVDPNAASGPPVPGATGAGARSGGPYPGGVAPAKGPVVRIARGNTVTEVTLGGKD
ncbi:Flp pilus assembly protein CpaB [Sphingomonas sp.]|uniref:Flp pilus assembly protein CpaB n=1 Tax=Sphingomonas sp. TaxID=28214 RepID=UPI001D860E16|nr:Flp pilus assembly protein CpaB [Sphingomonas sp.]MBX9797592.1 Flp pilus assembly protein CpaB [Sphingomonas sp.]